MQAAFETEVVCPSGDGMGGLYMALFVRCIRPLIDGIESWITRGVLEDPDVSNVWCDDWLGLGLG